MRFGGYCHFLQIHGHSLESDPYSVFNCLSVCSDDNDTKCSKLLRASLRGTSGNVNTSRPIHKIKNTSQRMGERPIGRIISDVGPTQSA